MDFLVQKTRHSNYNTLMLKWPFSLKSTSFCYNIIYIHQVHSMHPVHILFFLYLTVLCCASLLCDLLFSAGPLPEDYTCWYSLWFLPSDGKVEKKGTTSTKCLNVSLLKLVHSGKEITTSESHLAITVLKHGGKSLPLIKQK